MISPITQRQFERLKERYPQTELTELPSGAALVHVAKVSLPQGWSAAETDLWFLVPVGYPGPSPDCFWVGEDIRLAGGAMPKASQFQVIPETNLQKLWFSWHVVDQNTHWNPARDTLSTYMSICLDRLNRLQ